MPTIGLIGCGAWGRNILRDLRSLDAAVEVVAPSAENRAWARAHGAAAAHSHLEALGEVTGIVVAAPSSLHGPIIEQLLPRQVPIFVEKPMTTDTASARRIVDAAGDRVFVMDKWRYHPGIERIAALLREGELGRPLSIRTLRLGWANPHQDASAIWILLPHDLAIVLDWLGYLPPLRRVVVTQPADIDAGVIVQLGGGVDPLVTLEISTVSPEHRRLMSLVGTRAAAELADAHAATLTLREGPPGAPAAARRELAFDGPLPLYSELARFLAFLHGGPPPMSSAREGLAVVEMLDAIATRARDGG
jgi:predicted dehydrogenase